MSDKRLTDDPRELWRSQSPGGETPTLGEVRRRATAFERTIRRRNLREHVGAALVALFFGWHAATTTEPHVLVGSLLIVLAAVLVAAVLHRRGAAAPSPVNAALLPSLDFHRAQLERQRDLLRGIWTWYLLPLVPGLAVLLGGQVLAHPGSALRVGVFAAVCALLFLAVGWINRLAARSLQREIDELEDSK